MTICLDSLKLNMLKFVKTDLERNSMNSKIKSFSICVMGFIFTGAAFAQNTIPHSKFRVWEKDSLQWSHNREPIRAQLSNYTQKLDHFNHDARTFQQRYWVSKQEMAGSQSPVIFYICGETACGENNIRYMTPWAKKIKAGIVVIEHRFYGETQPFSTLSTANLRYMNVEQAMADFADIVRFLKQTENLKGPWIVIGGSYAGILASSFRLKYPNLVVGAWASAAPLNLVADYKGYDRKMAELMGETCSSQLRAVIKYAEEAVKDAATFANLRQKFGAETLTDAEDFLFSISDVAAVAVQYGYTKLLCDHMNVDDPIEGYAAYARDASEQLGYLPTSYSFASATDLTAGGPASDLRVFFYQQCTQIGLFQTAYKDTSVSVRSQRLDINYMRRGCQRLFGNTVRDRTQEFRRNYFLPTQSAKTLSEVYFVNGLKDPFCLPGIALEFGTWNNSAVFANVTPEGTHSDDLTARLEPTDGHKATHAQALLLLQKWSLAR